MIENNNLLEYREIDRKNDVVLCEVHLGDIRQGYRARKYTDENNFREICVNGPSWNKTFRKFRRLEAMEKSIDEQRGYILEKRAKRKKRSSTHR